MACRGIYVTLSPDQVAELEHASDQDVVLDILTKTVESQLGSANSQETDKMWDAIQQCLSGSLDPTAGSYPFNRCVLGGKQGALKYQVQHFWEKMLHGKDL